ncbi:MAG: ATP-binding protein, partial [Anaerolineales bacterium]
MVEIQQKLLEDPHCRLVTIFGPGGMGKTRLAVEAALAMEQNFMDGVYFVPLRSVSEPELVVPAILDALNLSPSTSDDPLEKLLDHLQNKQILVVMDNFEHLLEAARTLAEILQRTQNIKMLVTSRHALNVYGELVYPLRGLPFPTEVENINNVSFSSVQLFTEHAQRIRRDFSLTDHLQAVSRICRLVEGIPLAIELAASWSRNLEPEQIAAEIQGNIEFLRNRMQDVEESHRSMQAVFDQSWSLLSRSEQSVFKRLSVFRGGFEPEAARQIAAASLPVLTSLADKSLVRIDPEGRYQMHELLRQSGEERLASAPEEFDRIRDEHCSYYAEFMHAHLPGLLGGEQQEQLSDIVDDIDNLRTAWQWAVEQQNILEMQNLLHGLDAYFQYQSRYLEGMRAYEKAAESVRSLMPSRVRDYVLAQVLDYLAWFYVRLGQFDQATQAFEESRSIYTELAPEQYPPMGVATDPVVGLALVTNMRGNYDKAISLGETAREQNQARGDTRNLAFTYYTLTSAYMAKGEFEIARQCAEKAYNLAKSYDDNWFMAYILNEWGNVSRAMGRYAEAKERYLASYDIRESFNDPEGKAAALNHLGRIAILVNDYLEAKGLYQHSLSIYQEISDRGGLAGSFAGLGEVYCRLGDSENARQNLRDALHISLEIQHVPLTLSILISVAELYWVMGGKERSIELLTFVSQSAASERETRDRAIELLDQYKSRVPGFQ